MSPYFIPGVLGCLIGGIGGTWLFNQSHKLEVKPPPGNYRVVGCVPQTISISTGKVLCTCDFNGWTERRLMCFTMSHKGKPGVSFILNVRDIDDGPPDSER